MRSGGRAMNVGDSDEQYLFLPLAHILGREMVWAGFELGYTTAFSRGTNQIREDLVAVRPTFMAGVPRIYEKFYAAVTAAMEQGSPTKQRLAAWAVDRGRVHAAAVRAGRSGGGFGHWLADKLVLSKLRARLGLDRCRFLISGGAPLAPEIAEFFHAAGLLILEGYGLTETTSAVFLNTPERFRFGTVGPALDVVESRIAEDGEILVRGAPVFRQYYNNAEATAEAVEPDGWFHTGDIGVFEDGFLRITDRKKDLIVTAGGKKVAPQPLESALKAATPLVAQVLVYGDKRPYCVALVTPSEVALKQFGADAAASPRVEGGHPEGSGRHERAAGFVRNREALRDSAGRADRGRRRADAQDERQAQGRRREIPRAHRQPLHRPRPRRSRRLASGAAPLVSSARSTLRRGREDGHLVCLRTRGVGIVGRNNRAARLNSGRPNPCPLARVEEHRYAPRETRLELQSRRSARRFVRTAWRRATPRSLGVKVCSVM